MIKLMNEENIDIVRLDLLQDEELYNNQHLRSVLLLDNSIFEYPFGMLNIELQLYTELVWYNVVNMLYWQLKKEFEETEDKIEIKLFKTDYNKFCEVHIDNFIIFELTQNENSFGMYLYIPNNKTRKYSILERVLDITQIEKLIGSDNYGKFLREEKNQYRYSLNVGNIYFKFKR